MNQLCKYGESGNTTGQKISMNLTKSSEASHQFAVKFPALFKWFLIWVWLIYWDLSYICNTVLTCLHSFNTQLIFRSTLDQYLEWYLVDTKSTHVTISIDTQLKLDQVLLNISPSVHWLVELINNSKLNFVNSLPMFNQDVNRVSIKCQSSVSQCVNQILIRCWSSVSIKGIDTWS